MAQLAAGDNKRQGKGCVFPGPARSRRLQPLPYKQMKIDLALNFNLDLLLDLYY